jgi:hypothetical protein
VNKGKLAKRRIRTELAKEVEVDLKEMEASVNPKKLKKYVSFHTTAR